MQEQHGEDHPGRTKPKTIWQWIWSWGVVGTIVLFLLGTGISFMTSGHPYLADLFFLSGATLFLFKFLSWDLSTKHHKKRLIQSLAITIVLIIAVAAIYGNHYINHIWPSSEIKKISLPLTIGVGQLKVSLHSNPFRVCKNHPVDNSGLRISVSAVKNENFYKTFKERIMALIGISRSDIKTKQVVYGTISRTKDDKVQTFSAAESGTCLPYHDDFAIRVTSVLIDSECAEFAIAQNEKPCEEIWQPLGNRSEIQTSGQIAQPVLQQPTPPEATRKKIAKGQPITQRGEPTEQSKLAAPPPDIIAFLASPKDVQIILRMSTSSQSIIKSPRLVAVIWDLDLIERSDPIAKITKVFKDDYIRKENLFLAAEFTKIPPAEFQLIRPGHRLLGYMVVSCPDCMIERAYWLFVKYGEGGWYSELPNGQYPSMDSIIQLLPEIKKNHDLFFNDIPESSRQHIKDSPYE